MCLSFWSVLTNNQVLGCDGILVISGGLTKITKKAKRQKWRGTAPLLWVCRDVVVVLRKGCIQSEYPKLIIFDRELKLPWYIYRSVNFKDFCGERLSGPNIDLEWKLQGVVRESWGLCFSWFGLMVTFLRLRSVTIFQPRFLLGTFLR